MVGSERQTANRRGLGLAWLAGLLPLIAVGGWRLMPAAPHSLLIELPALNFEQPFEGHAAGLDRRGWQVAWLTRDGAVHQLRAGNGAPRLERYPTPCRPSAVVQGPGLSAADLTNDGLLDMVVIQDDVARADDDRDWVLPQRRDGTFGDGYTTHSTVRPSVPRLDDCFGAGGHFQFTGLTTPGGPRSRTRVSEATGRRPVAMLDGLVCHIADFDADGSDDVLTAEGTLQREMVILRLYLGQERGLGLAGEVTVKQGGLLGSPGDWTACADIDGDGRLEILACEQEPNRVRIWRLATSADDVAPDRQD